MFGHSMFGVFEVRYFGVRSKTSNDWVDFRWVDFGRWISVGGFWVGWISAGGFQPGGYWRVDFGCQPFFFSIELTLLHF